MDLRVDDIVYYSSKGIPIFNHVRYVFVASSPVKNLQVKSIESNLVVLSWKYPCMPNGKIAFFHSTLVGERLGFHNHIFSIKCDISVRKIIFDGQLVYLIDHTFVLTRGSFPQHC